MLSARLRETALSGDGTKDLVDTAIENAKAVNAGHVFVVVLRNAYPINVLDRIKMFRSLPVYLLRLANPLQVLVADGAGQRVIGVIDGSKTVGVEDEKGREWRAVCFVK